MTTHQRQRYIYRCFGRLTSRYPRLVDWLAERLSTSHFRRLPLTMLIGRLLIMNIMILSEVAENLVNSEPMVRVDGWFTQLLFQGRVRSISRLLHALTWLGSGYVTVSMALLGSFILYRQKKGRNIWILWVLMAGIGLFVQVGKRTFVRTLGRQR